MFSDKWSQHEAVGSRHMVRVVDGLFIGDREDAVNENDIHRHHIKSILSVCQDPPDKIDRVKNTVYACIRVADLDTEHLEQYFSHANAWIARRKIRGNVLIHCSMGISRSATIVCAYLISKYHYSFQDALGFLKARRSIVDPNDGFRLQLEVYAKRKSRSYHRNLLMHALRCGKAMTLVLLFLNDILSSSQRCHYTSLGLFD
jgi:atypical dual specificity phosphatase